MRRWILELLGGHPQRAVQHRRLQQAVAEEILDMGDAQSFDVVVGIGERVDFQLAAIARSGIDVANR